MFSFYKLFSLLYSLECLFQGHKKKKKKSKQTTLVKKIKFKKFTEFKIGRPIKFRVWRDEPRNGGGIIKIRFHFT